MILNSDPAKKVHMWGLEQSFVVSTTVCQLTHGKYTTMYVSRRIAAENFLKSETQGNSVLIGTTAALEISKEMQCHGYQ